ncbi:MAG TPA: SET domain-containing protein-lysine N-methyltransferase, partial [Candidatus Paceibacterota bacterium]
MQLTHDSRFAIKKSLPGVGQGLFAAHPIKKGVFVIEYTGERIPTKEANESDSRYLFEVDKNWTVDGPVPANLAGYVNHSCEPNTEAQIED